MTGLVADIGGTNARFALVAGGALDTLNPNSTIGDGGKIVSADLLPDSVRVYPVVSLPSVSDAITAYLADVCLLYTSPSPRDRTRSRMPSSA